MPSPVLQLENQIYVVREKHQLKIRKISPKRPGSRPTEIPNKELHSNKTLNIALWPGDFPGPGSFIVEFRFFANIEAKEAGQIGWTYPSQPPELPRLDYGNLEVTKKPNEDNVFVFKHHHKSKTKITIYYGILINDGGCMIYFDPESCTSRIAGGLMKAPRRGPHRLKRAKALQAPAGPNVSPLLPGSECTLG